MSDEKRQVIKASWYATRAKRKQQRCRVFELKVTTRHLSTRARTHLRHLFLEAKWFYNWILSQSDVFHVNTTIQQIPVKIGDLFEERPLRCLSSQMKQGLATRVRTSIQALATKKQQGQPVGPLQFKRSLRAIPLKQYGITYRFIHRGTRVKLQRVPGTLRVRGYPQLPPGAELANAVLLKKARGYYLKVTAYTARTDATISPNRSIGLDAGITHQFAFSNGVVVVYRVPVSQCNKLRRLYRQFSRKKLGSQNRAKALKRLRQEFEHLTNCKRDTVNKLVSFLTREYRIVCFQNENLRAWQRLYGAKMLDTALGTLFAAIQERVDQPMEVSRFYPSTQLCSNSGCTHRVRKVRNERVHTCPECGLVLDRDVNAARNIEEEGVGLVSAQGNLGAERNQSHARGDLPTTLTQRMVAYYRTIPGVWARWIEEAGSSLRRVAETRSRG